MVFLSSFRIKGINVKYWRVWMSYKIFVNSVTHEYLQDLHRS